MGKKKIWIIGAGIVVLFCVAWHLDSLYTPPVNQFSTPPNATAIDARLLAGSRHVAPLAHKQWLEEQMEKRLQEAAGGCSEPAEGGATANASGSAPPQFGAGIAQPPAGIGVASSPAGGNDSPPAGAGIAQPMVPPSYQYASGSYQTSNIPPAWGNPEPASCAPAAPAASAAQSGGEPCHFHVMNGNQLRVVVRR